MADQKKRLSTNVPGDFFVDSTCIDCDACRQLAPTVFAEDGEYSAVHKQPNSSDEVLEAWRALLACPVGSIGCGSKSRANEFRKEFPLQIENEIYYCGYNSKLSYGANSYFIVHPDGNWLVDSPRYMKDLVEQFEEMGGVKYIFLTHRDDIADAEKYAAHFGSQRIIHKTELNAQPDAEVVIEGQKAVAFGADFEVIPTPGHTEGHCVLCYKKKYLFTGDHLYWNREEQRLDAFRNFCWYSWDEQKASMKSLLNYEFEWVLPGHGQRVHLDVTQNRNSLELLVKRM